MFVARVGGKATVAEGMKHDYVAEAIARAAPRGPRKAVLWLCGERRRSGADELSALAGSEGCGTCADDMH